METHYGNGVFLFLIVFFSYFMVKTTVSGEVCPQKTNPMMDVSTDVHTPGACCSVVSDLMRRLLGLWVHV